MSAITQEKQPSDLGCQPHEDSQTKRVHYPAYLAAQQHPAETHSPNETPSSPQTAPPPNHLRRILKPRQPTLASEHTKLSVVRLTEIIRQLIGQLEQSRPGVLRDHSLLVTRLATYTGDAMGMSLRELSQLQLACLTHELGHLGGPHVTLASLNSNSSHAPLAQQQLENGFGFSLPPTSTSILKQRFEAMDGSGLPKKLQSEGILLGSRILAAVDAYVDFRRNLRNPAGKILPRKDAFSQLEKNSGKLFDERVLQALRTILGSSSLRSTLASDGRWLLFISPHVERIQELRKTAEPMGWPCRSSNALDDVLDVLQGSGLAALCLDLEFGYDDILALTEYIRLHPTNAALPIALVGKPSDENMVANLEQAGVDTFLPLPLHPSSAQEVLREMVEHHVTMGALGQTIYGSYEEMDSVELFDILSQQKKSGALWVRASKLQGNAFFEQGNLVFASWENKTGQQAVKTMISLLNAEFKFIPNAMWLPQTT